MKLNIELEDDLLRGMVNQQLAHHISQLTTEAINKEVERVFRLKMDRLTDAKVSDLVAVQIRAVITEALGGDPAKNPNTDWKLKETVSGLTQKVILDMVKGVLKNGTN